MLRAMDSAVAGLRAHQNKLDVIGHNIANVNTAGYKSQSYMFKEAMYQTSTNSTSGSGSAGGSGGVNAAQYGYGTMMGSIWVDMTASTPTQMGGLTATIDGQGFFMTMSIADKNGIAINGANASEVIKGSNFQYTRVGQFKIDSDGYLVDSNSNNFVYGFRNNGDCLTQTNFDTDNLKPIRVCMIDANGDGVVSDNPDKVALAKSVRIDSEGKIIVGIKVQETVTDAAGNTTTQEVIKEAVIGQVAVATFQNQEGLTKAGGSYYTASRGDNAGICEATPPGKSGTASLITGYVEASNVDMAREFSEMITTQRGFQANSRIITVSDQILEELVNMKR
ncbi:MAG: flagellar hook-basal body complex protein [Lachnospiraceae bacterium]|nr:flagellar hook-basal body complex protein [Lachnospiraceae bacterium]